MSNERQIENVYSIGDQIVHKQYGVGEIVTREEKELFGKTAQYYVVETENGTYWLPMKKEDNERIRPIADAEEIDEVIQTLTDKPEQMQDDFKDRKQRIQKATASGEFHTIATLVRDLSYRRAESHLTSTEEKEIVKLENRLVNEWAASRKTTAQKIRIKLHKMFRRHQPEQE